MSTTNKDGDVPDPRENPKAVIHEELGPHRDAIEKLAELDMGVLSDDAETALDVLDDYQEESS